MQINPSAHTTFIFRNYALGSWQLKTAVTPPLATEGDKDEALTKGYLQKGGVAQCAGRAAWWHSYSSDLGRTPSLQQYFCPISAFKETVNPDPLHNLSLWLF